MNTRGYYYSEYKNIARSCWSCGPLITDTATPLSAPVTRGGGRIELLPIFARVKGNFFCEFLFLGSLLPAESRADAFAVMPPAEERYDRAVTVRLSCAVL